MIILTKQLSTQIDCYDELHAEINSNVNILQNCLGIVRKDSSLSEIEIYFDNPLSASEEAELDNLLSNYSCPTITSFIKQNDILTNYINVAVFGSHKTIGKRWLDVQGFNYVNSNNTYYVVPFNSQLIYATFTNRYNTDLMFEIYHSKLNDGKPRNLIKKIDINYVRTAGYDLSSDKLFFETGDKISVKATSIGKHRADNLILSLYFIVVESKLINFKEKI